MLTRSSVDALAGDTLATVGLILASRDRCLRNLRHSNYSPRMCEYLELINCFVCYWLWSYPLVAPTECEDVHVSIFRARADKSPLFINILVKQTVRGFYIAFPLSTRVR